MYTLKKTKLETLVEYSRSRWILSLIMKKKTWGTSKNTQRMGFYVVVMDCPLHTLSLALIKKESLARFISLGI